MSLTSQFVALDPATFSIETTHQVFINTENRRSFLGRYAPAFSGSHHSSQSKQPKGSAERCGRGGRKVCIFHCLILRNSTTQTHGFTSQLPAPLIDSQSACQALRMLGNLFPFFLDFGAQIRVPSSSRIIVTDVLQPLNPHADGFPAGCGWHRAA